jgi:hypothetical protein
MAEDKFDDGDDPDDLYELPLGVVTYKNAVVLTGPGVISLAMTAEAATETAILLLKAAEIAEAAEAARKAK